MTKEQTLERIKEVLAGNGSFVMATVDEEGCPQARWMGALAPDPARGGIFYMASFSRARKVAQIRSDPATQLLLNTTDYSCVVTLSGSCEMVDDPALKRQVWEALPGVAQYFSGPEGEDFGVIRFTAARAEILCLAESMEPVGVEF